METEIEYIPLLVDIHATGTLHAHVSKQSPLSQIVLCYIGNAPHVHVQSMRISCSAKSDPEQHVCKACSACGQHNNVSCYYKIST